MSERKAGVRAHMENRHTQSWPILSELQEDTWERPVYSETEQTWRVKEILAHLADSERGMLGQVQRLVAGQVTVPPDFDLDRWNQSAVRKGAAKPVDQLVDQILISYQDSISFLEQLDDEALDLEGRHSRGDQLSIEGFFRRMADHRAEHAQDIANALDG